MSTLLRALRGEDTRTAPIWIMRQAGRHLPEYRALKERHDFWTLARTPDLTTEVTLQPVRRYGMDGAILFSDIMTPLPAMGLDLDFAPGPVLRDPVRDAAAVERLRVPDADAIAPYVGDAIRQLRGELAGLRAGGDPDGAPPALLGFGGAPLTLATYAVEGAGSKEYPTLRAFLRAEPDAAHALLAKMADTTAAYLRMQVEAGVQAVQLFDSWAGLHDEATYRTFGAAYAARVLDQLADLDVPRIYLALDAAHLERAVAELPADALSVDWRRPLSVWRDVAPGRVLQGNLDPAALLGPEAALADDACRVLREGVGGAHVFNLGHGIFPTTDPDRVAYLVDVVRAFDRHAEGA
ncbi:MAG: uroporphyrinogen decarboxylase [Trueperaceae bacterium]|nr:uroporphyrinogen decarboxylase [Trueperaceae bacterium]